MGKLIPFPVKTADTADNIRYTATMGREAAAKRTLETIKDMVLALKEDRFRIGVIAYSQMNKEGKMVEYNLIMPTLCADISEIELDCLENLTDNVIDFITQYSEDPV